MKIGVNSRIYQQSNTGIPYYIRCLYDNLLGNAGNLSFVFFQTSFNKKIGNTKILKLKNIGFLSVLFDLFFVNFLIKREKINIFHGPANILPFFKVRGVKYILTVHDLSFLIFPNNHSFLFNIYYRYAVARSLKNADIVVAVSKSTKKDILKFYKVPEDKIKVIYSGINDLFLNSQIKEKIIGDKYFLSITTHPKRKNTIGVLKAMSKNEELKKYKYVIVGVIPEDQLAELKNMINELGLANNVMIFGYASEDQLIGLYQNAEFFIYPSFYEGFGFPVLEAMACRCPVITSNNSSLTEIVPDKIWLVDPNNIDDISQRMTKIIKLSREDRYKLVDYNYNFSNKFRWKKTASEYIKLFKI